MHRGRSSSYAKNLLEWFVRAVFNTVINKQAEVDEHTRAGLKNHVVRHAGTGVNNTVCNVVCRIDDGSKYTQSWARMRLKIRY